MGICWGHQAIAYACGGSTEKIPNIDSYITTDKIHITDSHFRQLQFVKESHNFLA